MNLSTGDRFDGEVRLTRNGTGSVNVGSETISVGPLACEEGTRVQLRYLGTRTKDGFRMHYAVCLSNHAVEREEYDAYLREIVDLLTPNGSPNSGERTYVEIVDIDSNGYGYAEPGGQRIELGPVDAREGDFVQVEGYSETHARVVDDEVKGPNYDLQFWLLSGQHNKLPISIGDEYTTAIAEFEEEIPLCYVKDIPISLPGSEGQVGQKLDVRIDDFEGGSVVGEVLELYDEVSRIKNPGHWARMQWLREAGFDEPTFQTFIAEYVDVPAETLPDDPETLESALVGEAVRLCIADKASESDDSYPRAHLTGIRHWVTHKLEHILGPTDDETDWFRSYLDKGKGPTLSFLGDIIELSQGYYAAGPTRAVMVNPDTAVIISGTPTREFTQAGFEVEFTGLSRRLVDTSESELESEGIQIQSQVDYIGDTINSGNPGFLSDFIDRRSTSDWQIQDSWEAYGGESGFGLTWRDAPLEVKDDADRLVSLWREPVEYDRDEYYLRVTIEDEFSGVRIPHRYLKHIALSIDAAAETPRIVDLSPTPEDETLDLSCSFAPPRGQYRWLTAIGATWRGYQNRRIHWEIPVTAAESVIDTFQQLPVEINDSR